MASLRWMMVLALGFFANQAVGEIDLTEVLLDDANVLVQVAAEDQAVEIIQIQVQNDADIQAKLQQIIELKQLQAEQAAAEEIKRKDRQLAMQAEIAKTKAQLEAAQVNLKNIAVKVAKKLATQEELKRAELQVKALTKKLAELQKVAAGGEGDDEPADENPDAAPPATPAKQSDPRAVKLQMTDGTKVSGLLKNPTLQIETRFGTLAIPISKIRYFRPGLNSDPNRKAQFDDWIDKLGSDDSSQRKVAADALKKLGQPVKPLLEGFAKDANATRAKEVRAILDWLVDQSDFDEFDTENPNALRLQDTVATTEFTMTGRILQESFTLESEFGQLEMALKDIVVGQRNTGEAEVIRKAFSITQTNLCARGFKTIGIRVQKGDKISIRASGTLGMRRWGSNAIATPDGAPNYGWYINGKIPNGALCAKIGSNAVFKVGSKFKVTAKETGVLQFGIGITDRYAKSSSYQWPGTYKVRVQIERQ